MPDFAYNVGFGVDSTHTLTELLPKRVIIDLSRHIQTPTINPKSGPMLSHIKKELAYDRSICVEFR